MLEQTYPNIAVKIINDDPEDLEVEKVMSTFGDSRVSLFSPTKRRGPTPNFNIPFDDSGAEFVAILEDDNWWEPTFLAEMHAALSSHPDIQVAVGNELVWREMEDGSWLNTQERIWDFCGLRLYHHTPEQVCGSTKLCNSSSVFRMTRNTSYKIPETIPVDVTEHFRERLITPPILLLGNSLVNFAQTRQTARAKSGNVWNKYQCLLIGSLFLAQLDRLARHELARRLWRSCPSPTSPRAVSLIMTGVYLSEARALLANAPLLAIVRFGLWAMKHPRQFVSTIGLRQQHRQHLDFLVNAPLTRNLVRGMVC